MTTGSTSRRASDASSIDNSDRGFDPPTEASPLLESTSPTITPASTAWNAFLLRHIVPVCMITIFCLEVGDLLQMAPVNRILEGIICRDFYPEHAGANPLSLTDDPRCKSTDVQSKLAMLRGWQSTLDFLPGIICAVPYGLISDKYGRKIVVNLSLLGLILGISWYAAVCWLSDVFPVWVTLTSSLFRFIGGGSSLFAAGLFTMIADAVPDDERATSFFRLGASVLVAELVASPISGALTDRHPWAAVCLGLGILCLGFCLTLAMPETIQLSRSKTIHPDIDLNTESENVHSEANDGNIDDSKSLDWNRIIYYARESLNGAAHFIAGNFHVVLLLFTSVVSIFGRYIQELLLQYITKRVHFSWSQAAYLMSFRSASALLLLTVILPSISHYLITHLSMTTRQKDLWLVRASSLFLVAGTLIMGLSGHPVPLIIGLILFALGCGFSFLIRSLMTSMVEPHYVATLYNTAAICEGMGLMSAGPALSAAFRRGLQLGGAWIGMPLFISSGLFAIAAIIVWTVRIPDLTVEEHVDEESGSDDD